MNYTDKYLDYIKYERKLSINTYKSYQNEIKSLKQYFKINDNESDNKLLHLKYQDLIKYIDSFNLDSRSIAHKITVINSFYDFLVINDILKENPMENIKSPKLPQKLPEFLTEEEINKLLDINLITCYDYRNKAMLEVLYATGLRISELTHLEFSNIDLENDFIRVIGKGSKERIVPLNEVAHKYLELYLNDYRNEILKGKSSTYLFISNAKKEISRQAFFKILKNECKRAGITKDASPHVLRHSFATHLLYHGADIRVIQELLGHSDISTTEIYASVINQKVKKDYENAHPRSHKS